MSEEDRELENLKAKRLAEMQRNLSYKKMQQEMESNKTEEQKKKPSHRQLVVNHLGYRGSEVLENAESQFPGQSKIIIDKLGELYSTGEINENLDGGQLLALFRSVGINVRLKTQIKVEQKGKFVSLSERLSLKSSSPDDSSAEEKQGD